MKYFTKEWCFGLLSEQKTDEIYDSYKAYVSKVYDKLPYVLKLLSTISLHDGKIKNISFSENEKILQIQGVFGDLEIGYFDMSLKYIGVLFKEIPDPKDKSLVILRDEIEVFDDSFVHRMITSSKLELQIGFSDMEISMKNATPQQYKTCEIL